MDDKKNSSNNDELEKFKIGFEHAWSYFTLHANQRITLFRYYIIFFSFFASGASVLFVKFPSPRILHELAAIILSLAFLCISIVFDFLDRRNRQLIHIAEEAIRSLEKKKYFTPALKIFTNEQNEKPKIRHTLCFRIIFIAAYLLTAIYIIATLISIYYYTCLPNPVYLMPQSSL